MVRSVLLHVVVSGLGPAGAPDERAAENALTPRETTVLLLTDELTADAIGRWLGISVRTVHERVENIYRNLGTRDVWAPCCEPGASAWRGRPAALSVGSPCAIPFPPSGRLSSLDVTRPRRPVHQSRCSGWTRAAGGATIPMLVVTRVRCAGPRTAA